MADVPRWIFHPDDAVNMPELDPDGRLAYQGPFEYVPLADHLAALERVRVMDAAVGCRCDRLPADWDALRTDPLGHHPRCPSSSSAATTGDTDD